MIIALGRHLADSTVFALVIWLICICMRRRGPAARYALWLIAVAKFVVPTVVFFRLGEDFRRLLPSREIFAIVPPAVSQWVIPSTAYNPSEAAAVNWSTLLILMWAAGAAVTFALWIRKLRTFSVSPALPDDSQPIWFLRLKVQIGLRGNVRLALSDSVREPALAGLRRPVVLIPALLRRELSAAELESVVLHELAHAKRRDNWTAAFAHVVTCLFWFYPLLWWLEKRLHHERERACDEIVIRCGATADDYFAGILKVCRFHLAREIAGVAGISGSNLKNRKEAIMSVVPENPTKRVPNALIGALIAAVVVIPLVIGLLTASNAYAAAAGFAGNANAVQGTKFSMARQANAPAQFIEATFGIKSLLLRATLKNVGKRPINRYRVGWIVVYRDGKTDMSSGPVMNVPAEIAPGAVAQVPDQGISGKVLDTRPHEIMFFVAEARFSTGEVWKANTRPITTEATAHEPLPINSDSKNQKPIMCSYGVDYPEGTVIQVGDLPQQVCARVPLPVNNPDAPPMYAAAWIRTSETIRSRGATVVHLPVPPVAVCAPKAPVGKGLCSCEDGGVNSPGAIVNSSKSPFQLRCGKDGNWIQTKTPNVER